MKVKRGWLDRHILNVIGHCRDDMILWGITVQHPVLVEMMTCMWEQRWVKRNISKWIVKNLNSVSPCLVACLINHMSDNIGHDSVWCRVVAHLHLKQRVILIPISSLYTHSVEFWQSAARREHYCTYMPKLLIQEKRMDVHSLLLEDDARLIYQINAPVFILEGFLVNAIQDADDAGKRPRH